jgi:hypothetical protein
MFKKFGLFVRRLFGLEVVKIEEWTVLEDDFYSVIIVVSDELCRRYAYKTKSFVYCTWESVNYISLQNYCKKSRLKIRNSVLNNAMFDYFNIRVDNRR